MRSLSLILLLYCACVTATEGQASSSTGVASVPVPSPVPNGSPEHPLQLLNHTAASFVIDTLSVPLFVKNMLSGSVGNFSVVESVLAANRSTVAVLQGRALKSAIFTFSFTPLNPLAGLQTATIAINVTAITVAAGKSLKWYKFNVVTEAWDLKGGTVNSTTGLLEYTTTSFSDWSVQETDPADDSSKSTTTKFVEWVQSQTGVIVLCATGVFMLILVAGYYSQKKHWKETARPEDRDKEIMPILKSPKRLAGVDEAASDAANLSRMPPLNFTRKKMQPYTQLNV